MGLIIKCPRCDAENVWMHSIWDEYLCQNCLKSEERTLRERRIDSDKKVRAEADLNQNP